MSKIYWCEGKLYSLKIQLFKDLFEKFLALNSEVEAIIVSDREGFIIAGEKKRDNKEQDDS